MSLFVEDDFTNYYQKEENSIWETLQKHKGNLPRIRFDCGNDNLLIAYNRILHQQLENQNILQIHQEFPGAHKWSYWQEHIKESLLFFSTKDNVSNL